MFLGALLHCGFDKNILDKEIQKLHLGHIDITAKPKKSCSIAGIKVDISSKQQQELRTLPKIQKIIETSSLSEVVKTKSLNIFQILAKAEAHVHDCSLEEIHFHEVGAIDTLVDIVGTVCGLQYLNIEKLYCSPLPMGSGFVQCDHGKLPLPAPAVCSILKGIPVQGATIQKEIVTPTGAALVKGLVNSFGSMPDFTITCTGYGCGSHNLPDQQPNVLRMLMGKQETATEAHAVTIVETNLDDWSPETFPYLCSRLLEHGALDVSLIPIQMKKGRSGFTLQVICPSYLTEPLSRIIFCETTTIGIRYREEKRITLPREIIKLSTQFGTIQAKKVQTPEGIRIYPEYEACAMIAEQTDSSIAQVYRAVIVEGEKL